MPSNRGSGLYKVRRIELLKDVPPVTNNEQLNLSQPIRGNVMSGGPKFLTSNINRSIFNESQGYMSPTMKFNLDSRRTSNSKRRP